MQKLTETHSETAETENVEKENTYGLKGLSSKKKKLQNSKYPAKILPTYILNINHGNSQRSIIKSSSRKKSISIRSCSKNASKSTLKLKTKPKMTLNKSVLQGSKKNTLQKQNIKKTSCVNKYKLLEAATKHAMMCHKFQEEISKFSNV